MSAVSNEGRAVAAIRYGALHETLLLLLLLLLLRRNALMQQTAVVGGFRSIRTSGAVEVLRSVTSDGPFHPNSYSYSYSASAKFLLF